MKTYIPWKRLLIALAFTHLSLASLPEFYGPSARNSAIGNQATFMASDPGNLYYVPSLSAYAQNISINANISNIHTKFKKIDNIVTANSTNGQTGSNTDIGSAKTNYSPSYHTSFHALFPLIKRYSGTLGLSYYSPIGDLVETNSGQPALPEYVMYRSRYNRTQLQFSYAYPLSENWAFALGAHLGFQTSARINTKISLNSGQGSYASMRTKVSPSLGTIFSLTRRSDSHLSYITFQQEMKSNLSAITTGDITNPPLTLIDIGIASLVYYDPHIFRLGHAISLFKKIDLMATLEYQLWENYKTPLIRITNQSGPVESSSNFENLKLRNIFYPRLGWQYHLTPKADLMGGLAYRQSPLKKSFNGSGNSIDSDSMIFSAGLAYKIKLSNKSVHLALSGQYHQLEKKDVTKTNGQENGSSGQKIGAPGYKIGGSIVTVQTGLQVTF